MARANRTNATGRALGKDLVHRGARDPDDPPDPAVAQRFGYQRMAAAPFWKSGRAKCLSLLRWEHLLTIDQAGLAAVLLAMPRSHASLRDAFRSSWASSASC